jgi:hypothetical protein
MRLGVAEADEAARAALPPTLRYCRGVRHRGAKYNRNPGGSITWASRILRQVRWVRQAFLPKARMPRDGTSPHRKGKGAVGWDGHAGNG